MLANRGSVVIGTSHDTPEFAVDAVVEWWCREGRRRHPGAEELLILADSAVSNRARCRLWKYALQEKLVDPYQVGVTVCHCPPAPPNGIPSSTDFSARSANGGRASL